MIRFLPIEKSDLETMKQWRNSEYVYPYVREYRLLNDHDQEEWYDSYLASRRKSDFDQELYIIWYLPDKKPPSSPYAGDMPIGVGGFTRIEWRNRKAELSFYIGEPEYDYLREPSLRNLIEKGFKEFGFHKIYWPVYSHDPNIELYKQVMDVEAVLKNEYFWDGKLNDRIYLSKFNY